MDNINIIMYHYIRKIKGSGYPKIKGLELQDFKKQIEFLMRNFKIISVEDILRAEKLKIKLSGSNIALTFDDGYLEHYKNVFPILKKNNISGFFSMPSEIIEKEKILDVNKIHYILASVDEIILKEKIFKRLNFYRGREFDIPDNKELYKKLAKETRFDNKDIIFIKRLLQTELDERLRNLIVGELFKEYVAESEKVFCKKLYMSYEQLKEMKKSGMEIGIHAHSHNRLGNMNEEEMKKDINKSLEIFEGLIDKSKWIMCYPYGSYNKEVIDYIIDKGCIGGLTTEVRTVNLDKDSIYKLPRLDTNDYPPKSNNYINIK